MNALRLVKHVSCTYAIYKSLGSYDEDTLYCIEDGAIYKGSTLLATASTGNVEYSSTVPDADEMEDGVSYIVVTEDGQVVIYQKDDEGEVEVVASSISKEDIDELVTEIVKEYTADGASFSDVNVASNEDEDTILTFTKVNGEEVSVTITDLFLSNASYDTDTHILTLIVKDLDTPVEVDLSEIANNKVDKVEDATEWDVVLFGADGSIQDAGVSVGAAELSDDPSSNVLATEAAVAEAVKAVATIWDYIDSSSIVVNSYEEVLSAMNDDTTKIIALGDDIECADSNGFCLSNGSEKTVNLNGHNVTGLSNYEDGTSVAFVVLDGTLTINGDGDVYGGSGSESNIAVRANGENAKIIINGGNYNVGNDKDESGNSTIYAQNSAQIEIYGGHFDNDANADTKGPERYVLNIQNNTGATITCYGGEYVDQNPADGDDKDTTTGATFLADGCIVTEIIDDEHTTYVVSK